MGTGPRQVITQSVTEMRAALGGGGIVLGLDTGTKTIGLATADPAWRFATAGKTIRRAKFTADKAQLATMIAERGIKGLVVGLPLNMDGSESPRSQGARAMARNLEDLGLPILLWDERWSTQAAERTMIEQDFSRAKRAERIDSHAAALILQGAIDALRGAAF